MVNRQVVLVLLAVTLFGALSGFIVTLVKPVRYQAMAYVIVNEMPKGLNNIIGTDEAANLNDVYRAGVLQDAVINEVRKQLPEYTAKEIAQSIQVEIVAYTPLTRLTATATTPDGAAKLANVVASAWAGAAGAALNKAYTDTNSALQAREEELLRQITAAEDALAAHPSPAVAAQLQTQLATLQNSFRQTLTTLVDLDRTRFEVAGNAFVQMRASPSDAVKTPDPLKYIGVGTGIGASLGLLLALWLMARRWKSWNGAEGRGLSRAGAMPGAIPGLGVEGYDGQ